MPVDGLVAAGAGSITHTGAMGVTDPFSSRATKLGALTALSEHARVLLVGLTGTPWEVDFTSAFRDCMSVTQPELSASLRPHDFAVCMVDQGNCDVAALRAITASSGWLMLMTRDARSVIPARSSAQHADRLVTRLRDAGFTHVAAYTATPSLLEAEEFLGAGATAETTRRGWVRNVRARLLNAPADRVLMCTTHGRSLITDLETISQTAPLSIERFALRARGALLLIVRDGDGQRFVTRVTTSDTVDRVVSRNAAWTDRIHAHAAAGTWLRARIPRQAGSRRTPAHTVYMENCIAGTIGWKVAGNASLEPRLFRDVWRFAGELADATAVSRAVNLDEVKDMLAPLACAEAVDQDTHHLMNKVRDTLAERVAGDLESGWAWSHGDYGYGNVLADPETGGLNGVIDWDQARDDLSGVDLVNFLVQRHRIIHGASLPAAVAAVAERLLNGMSGDPLLVERLPVNSSDLKTLIAWTLLRMVQRDVQYASIFERDRSEIHVVLQSALEFIRHD